MLKLILIALIALAPLPASAADKGDRVAKLIAKSDGLTKQAAFKVKSVNEEYEVLTALGVKPQSQDLIIGDDGHPYDMLTVLDPKTGTTRQVWFDIASFYGKDF